jgi:putative ATPase
MELFSNTQEESNKPLADRMRPRSLEEFLGQEHIIGKGRLLRRAIQADQLTSLIFYGPPGTGKTTLAQVIANTTESYFTTLNAVLTGVKDLRETINQAREYRDVYGRKTILFVDEVHRWNKAQQDALLPWVENGTVVLIGATTENPFFEVNRTLISRSRIFQLTPLSRDDLLAIAQQALTDKERGYGGYTVEFEQGALEHLVDVSDGDGRTLLNALELAVETTPEHFPPPPGEKIYISMETAEESIQKRVVLYDKEGDYHFDTISAFIKSLRGSDPDAALYWLARMVEAGEDPRFILRRLLILCSEDVGMADPAALQFVEAAAAAFDRVGMPEGRFHLAHATLYIATAPKSNSAMAFFDALDTVEKESRYEVPSHLRDPNRDQQGLGHGDGYLYPHAYRDHWVAQQYLPAQLQGKLFYRPSDQGFEASIREDVLRKREAQLEATAGEAEPEVLTYTPPSKAREAWLQRITEGKGEVLTEIKQKLFAPLTLPRYARVLVTGDGGGFLIWEAFRRVPEGGVYGLIPSRERRALIEQYGNTLPEYEQPILIESDLDSFSAKQDLPEDEADGFDAILGRNTLLRYREKEALVLKLAHLLQPGGSISLAEAMPAYSTRLSTLIRDELEREGLREKIEEAEKTLYEDQSSALTGWDSAGLQQAFSQSGFTDIRLEEKQYQEQRFISEEALNEWLGRGGPTQDSRSGEDRAAEKHSRQGGQKRNPYAAALRNALSEQELKRTQELFLRNLTNVTVPWTRQVLFINARKST